MPQVILQNAYYCSKTKFFRITFIFGIIFMVYLLVYDTDITSTTTAFAQTVLQPLVKSVSNNETPATLAASTSRSSIITTLNTSTIPNTTMTTPKVDKTEQVTTMNETVTVKQSTMQTGNISDQPKEAFVTFCNNDPRYLSLLKVFLESVHTFSTRPVIAFGIDVDLDIDVKQFPRVIKRRIAQSDCGQSVFFCKIYSIISSNVDYGILMEPDDVVNYNIDILFDVARVWPYPVSLSPRHPDDPQNYHEFMRQYNVSKKTTPYIHAHVVWNYRSIPFLKNIHSILQKGGFMGSNFDETAVNVMSWKAGANHTLCKYDPFFTFSEAYEKWPVVSNCTQYCHTVFLTLHGSKEYDVSLALLKRLKNHVGKPTLQLPGMGGLRYINDTTATCCYADSKPSPIHPLLCEHS